MTQVKVTPSMRVRSAVPDALVPAGGRPSTVNASNWKEMPNFFNPFWRATNLKLASLIGDILA